MRSAQAYAYFLGFVGIIALLSYTILSSQVAQAAADTCTWTGGGADSNITTAGNWTGCDNGNVPENNDNLVFPVGPANKTVLLNAGLFFDTVTFSGSGYTVNTTNQFVNELFIEGDFTISGDNNTFNSMIRMLPVGDSTFTHSASGTEIVLDFIVQSQGVGHNLFLDIETDLTVLTLAHAGANALDTVYKTGPGTLAITGDPTTGLEAAGGIEISEGTWQCGDTINCLGDSGNDIILEEGGDSEAAVLQLDGAGTIPHNIIIATTTGDPGTVLATADVNLTGTIDLFTDGRLAVSDDATMTIDGDVSIANNQTLMQSGAGSIVQNGVISGAGDMTIEEAHVTLAGTNTYTGTTELIDLGNGAIVTVKNNAALGNASAGTTVNDGTTLNFDNGGDAIFSEPITVGGNGVGGSYPGAMVKADQLVSLTGGVTLTADTILHNETTELFAIDSVITGDYNITMTTSDDAGGFAMEPGGDNSFNDLTAIGTQLTLDGGGSLVIPGSLTVNAVDGFTSRVWLNSGDNMIADDSAISLNNDGSQEAILVAYGVTDTVGTISGDGVIALIDEEAHLRLGGGETSGTFSGEVQGFADSMLEFIGGTWTFTGTNTDTGDGFTSYYVNGGRLISNATGLGSSPFSMSAGVLGGTGAIGPLSVYAGTLAPGNSPGCLNPQGDVALADENSTFDVEINGATPCSGYDVLEATGDVFLNGAVLSVSLLDDYTPTHGVVLTILKGASINGVFDGLADGNTVSVDGVQFRINYTDTTVTLTDLTPAGSSLLASLANTGLPIYAVVVFALVLVIAAMYTRRTINNRL